MNGLYKNEFGEYQECLILSCPIYNYSYVLIEFPNGDRGYCTDNLIEEY